MKTNRSQYPSIRNECQQRRLAESSVAAVDSCSCGMMKVHLGALTLRLTPEAVSVLIETLSRAVETQTNNQPSVDLAAMVLGSSRRGEA